MPQIIVTDDLEQSKVMLRERVNATDFESDRFGTNLLERLGWAVEDAERRELASDHDAAALPEGEYAPAPEPTLHPEPVGVI